MDKQPLHMINNVSETLFALNLKGARGVVVESLNWKRL